MLRVDDINKSADIAKLPRIYAFGEFEIDIVEESLRRNGEKLSINRRTFGVLRQLVQRSGQIVSKQDFFDTVWADAFVEDNSLTVAMTTLRKLLGDDPKQPKFIENLPRKGYRFIGEATKVNHVLNQVRNGHYTAPIPASQVATGHFFRDRKFFFLILVVSLLSFSAVLGLNYVGSPNFGGLSASSDQIESIAVLPFENPDADIEYLSDGLAESIINDLSKLPNLRVISRNSVFQFKNKEKDLQTIGRELNVRAVLTGRLVRSGDSLVISAELTDLRNNRQIWGRQYDRKIVDALELQRDIARDVSEKLRSTSTEEQRQFAQRQAKSPEAYQLYLKGHFFWNKRTEEGYAKAVEFFNQALEKDPTYALAYVGLANVYAQASFKYITTTDERLALVKGALNRVLEIDGNLGEAYAALALTQSFYEWDWTGAEQNYKRAIELNPNYATARHWYADFLALNGRFDESLAEYDRALALDPLSHPIQTDKGMAYLYARQPEHAIAHLERLQKINPDYARTYGFLSTAYALSGRFEESIQALATNATLEAKNYELAGQPTPDVSEIVAALRNGLSSGGAVGFRQATLTRQLSENPDPWGLATIYAQLGKKDKAFEQLEKAYLGRHASLCYIKARPDLDPLHDDPRFTDLVRRVGLPE